MLDFSEFMRKARGDMSLYELSRRTGITSQQLSNYERGRSRATIDKASLICKALNVTFVLGVYPSPKGAENGQEHPDIQ
ncbi:helix-turn-helix domain-containing protein [Selenomonas ruminantium]|uniref:helix-turn-helix domain-containing protein n=1 Tax=Selenomonas ruminantium TaxID=971 RepID=UPI0009B63675|nr:helix-turn-helix transcriptional regulator [Selenomonas ruminantium]